MARNKNFQKFTAKKKFYYKSQKKIKTEKLNHYSIINQELLDPNTSYEIFFANEAEQVFDNFLLTAPENIIYDVLSIIYNAGFKFYSDFLTNGESKQVSQVIEKVNFKESYKVKYKSYTKTLDTISEKSYDSSSEEEISSNCVKRNKYLKHST